MISSNKFYSTDNGNLDVDGLKIAKRTNSFYINVLQALMESNGDIAIFKKKYNGHYKAIINETINSEAIRSLRLLVIAMEKNPKNAETFLKSDMVRFFVKPLLNGTNKIDSTVNEWEKYLKNIESYETIKGATILSKVLTCYKESDKTCPIGLNFKNIFGTLVKTDANGKFTHLEPNLTQETKSQLFNAAQTQIDTFKNLPKFKNNFTYQEEEASECE